MILTKECDYAFRIIRQLADGEIHTVATICGEETIPLNFAYKILKRLEKASILKSYRGQSGGYKLIKGLGGIALYDVVMAIDGPIYFNTCLKGEETCPNNDDGKDCIFHEEFCRIQDMLIQSLSDKTIGDFIGH